MNVNTTGLIYFSPTHTTRKVVEGIAQGLRVANVQSIDLTPPHPETQRLPDVANDLAIIGSPVYAGRLPATMLSRIQRIEGNGAPAVIVVVYGNRAYEDALLELRDLALGAGFKPIAAAAFIGEHSYSTHSMPIAAGRPDADDLGKARAFGEMIREKMADHPTSEPMDLIRVPGKFPHKELRMLSDIAPAINENLCAGCKKCVSVCPTAAIHADNPTVTDPGSCIRCCACVKICPAEAKSMDDSRIQQAAEQLYRHCRNRKEPETYV